LYLQFENLCKEPMSKVKSPARDEPWDVLGSRYLIEDRWITVRADDCRTPSGHSVSPYYVLEYPPWVNVLALTESREAVLIRQYRHGVKRTILEFPGGGVDDADDSALECARRELVEETGYVVSELVQSACIPAAPDNHDNEVHFFVGTDARYSREPRLEQSEQIEVVLMPLDELVQRAYAGELEHPHHVAGLFFALRLLGERTPDPDPLGGL
jgi:8-oxo-dGTP pyrophosphatase MutT (NUDIX family)